MKKLTRKEVIAKLEKGDKDFRGLDLKGLDLRLLDLSNANLYYSDLSKVDLANVNLSYANLYRADLSDTNLSYANLYNANLSNANLKNSDLSNAYAYSVNLDGADLRYSVLCNTDLSYANLSHTNLSQANLSHVDLSGANLSNIILDEKEQIRKGIILKKPMIGYKRCKTGLIVTLYIPKGAIVFSINNKKCRTNKAKVVDISRGKRIAYSFRDNSFAYELGKDIRIEDFDLRYNEECSTGIHFFKTREEAENY